MLTKFKNVTLIFALIAGLLLNSCNQATTKNDASQEESTDQVQVDHPVESKKKEFSKFALFHHANATFHTDGNSLNWLKENNIDLFHHAKGSFYTDTNSLNWLKENNLGLYHHANATFHTDGNSLNWLKENNIDLFHHAKGSFYTDINSLNWLKN